MGDLFKVAIHHDNDCGYIEYDPATQKVSVVLDDAAKRAEIERYLSSKQVIRVAQSLRDFTESKVLPTESLAVLQIALTKLWENTEVFVDWSRPVDVK